MNHSPEEVTYGLWGIVLVNSAVFIIFAFSFFQPSSRRDWRTFGSFSAFIVALFVEMYGFPLTIYLLSGWLQGLLPGVDLLSHDAGHLWYSLLGFEGNPHLNPIHLMANAVIVSGFVLLSASWRVLWAAQRDAKVACSGPYRFVRHPQYLGFVLIMLGFLVMWPTLLTLVMFPILVFSYVRLAHCEERAVRAELGQAWTDYSAKTPRWVPRLHDPKGSGRAAGTLNDLR